MDELIKALRNHRSCDEDECTTCELMNDAADALEAAEQRIAELEKQDSVEMHKKQVARIAELEAQLLNGGEWIAVKDWLQIPQEERGTYRCSACGQVMKYPWNYCPNCGAKMKTVTDCHASGEGERKEKKNEKDSDTI